MSGFRIPLVVSIVLNVFLVGVLAGGVIRFEMSKPPAGRGNLIAASNQLPEPERATLLEALSDVRRDAWPTIREGRQARLEAVKLLQQPTLDKPTLLAALDRARKSDIAVRTLLEQRIVEFAATSSSDIRRTLAEWLMPPGAAPKK